MPPGSLSRSFQCASVFIDPAHNPWLACSYHPLQDQVLQRSFMVEAPTVLAASPDGGLLVAGGASGTLYLWEVPSGRLLRTWAAHYKVCMCA